jgi:hypothetical protein
MALDGDFPALDSMIESVRAAGRLIEDAAPEVAKAVEAQLRSTAAAGQSPNGTPWAPKKKGGGRALVNAAGAISVAAIGSVILVKLVGKTVFHHFGAQGKPRRQVIPVGTMPKQLGNAVRLGFVPVWRDKVKRGRR